MNKSNELLAVVLSITIAKLFFIAFTIDRGFDITDEGFLLLYYRDYDLYQNNYYSLYSFIAKLAQPFNLSIVGFRAAKMILEIFSVLLLCYGVLKWLISKQLILIKKHSYLWLISIAGMGLFLGKFTKTIGYNELTAVNLYICGGLLFLTLSNQKRYIIVLLIGLIMGIQLFLKFPATIMFTALCVVLVLFKYINYRSLLAYFSGVIIAVSLWVYQYGGIEAFKTHFIEKGLTQIAVLGMNVKVVLLKSYYQIDLLQNGIYWLIPLVIFIVGLTLIKRNKLPDKATNWLLFATIVVWLIISYVFPPDWLTEFRYRLISVIIILLFVTVWINLAHTNRAWLYKIAPLAILFLLPLLGTFGSNNPNTITLYGYLPPWFLLIAILAEPRRFKFNNFPKIPFQIIVLTVIFSTVIFYNFYWLHPHELPTSLNKQTKVFKGYNTIKIDAESHQFFTMAKSKLNESGFKAGDPIIAIYDMAGLVYLLNGTSPSTAWYINPKKGLSQNHIVGFNCQFIDMIEPGFLTPSPFLLLNKTMPDAMTDCLKDNGLWGANSYNLVETIFNPYSKDSISIYAPINIE